MKRKIELTALLSIGLLFCSCSDLTNPFLNKEEAKAEITNWQLSDSVTINIFSTYSIPVRVLLGEHLDSFKVHIDNNRLWGSQDSVISRREIKSQYIYSFPFSFYDTGWQKIKLVSYRSNSDSVVDSCVLYAVSPLKQNAVSGMVGDSLILKTLPVNDKQVLYVWNFFNGMVIKEYACSVGVKITAPFTSSYGQLYVEDFSEHRSPATLFEIVSQSQTGLSLVCINDSIRGDTVFSADAQLKFRLEVSGAQQITKASINGSGFDESQRRGNNYLLSHNLNGLDTLTTPQALKIDIKDNLGRSLSKTFYIKFVKLVPVISVAYPEDSMQTSASSVNVLGTVSNIRQNSVLYLSATNNGKEQAKVSLTANKPVFSFEIPLQGASNHISLELFADSLMEGSMLAVHDFYTFYNPFHIDTTAPQIRNIRCNGTLVDSLFTSRSDTMSLEIDAVDNSNKLTVTVNGQPAVKQAGELFYSTKVILDHKKESTVIVIQATDSAGYSAADTIYVRYNRLPRWDNIPTYTVINAGEDNRIQISVIDPDGDPLLVTMTIPLKSGDKVIDATSGQVTWVPQISDTGVYVVKLEATDEYEVTDTFFSVLVKGAGAIPVQLLTSETDFPATLFIGDTLEVTLQEIPLSGTRPFRYSAYFIDNKPQTILNGTDSVLRWIPARSDAGLRKLCIQIMDGLNTVDSDTIEIMVILATVKWEKSNVQFYENSWMNSRPKAILSRPLNFPVSIGYEILFPYNPGATEKDITSSLKGTIEFEDGDTIASLNLSIANDTIPENQERFVIKLLNNDSLFSDVSVLECEIIDDDRVNFYFETVEMRNDENDSTIPVIVKISKPLEKRLVLSLVDSNSSAKQGEDFIIEGSDGKVLFEPGDTQAVIYLKILDDTIAESDEKIVLALKSDSSFALPKKDMFGNDRGNVFTYTIVNDDVPIKYSFSRKENSGTEGDTVSISVRLDSAPKKTILVNYSLDNDPSKTTAVLDTDFRFVDNSGILTFAPGETYKQIRIILIDDAIPKDNIFFTLNLHSESGQAFPGDNPSLKYTILSNEVKVTIIGNWSGVNEYTHSEINITFSLEKPLNTELRVYFAADDSSTAKPGKDYNVIGNDYLVFKPGETMKNMLYKIIDDDEKEETEFLIFRISSVSDNRIAYIGNESWIRIDIEDNDFGVKW